MPVDMSMAKAPPRRSSGSRTPATRAAPAKTIDDKRAEAVGGLFQLVQYGCILTKNYADAAAIGMHAEGIARETAKLAAEEEKVAKAVDYLLEVGPYAGLVAATMPLVLQLAANHKVVPANKVPGVVDPNVLTTQMEARLKQQAAEQMREAQQMQAEADEALAAANGSHVAAGATGDEA
jgi:hypothetical protein